MKSKDDFLDTITEDEDIGLPPEYSEGRLSERFTERYADTVRYVEEWGSWVFWDKSRWRKSKTHPFNFARLIAKQASSELKQKNDLRIATLVYSNRVIAAIESIARKNIDHLSPSDEFDADDWFLNTPDGVIDLQTGKLLPHHPKYKMTKMTAVTPDFDMATPIWNNFLATTLTNDPGMISFLQRLTGYFLTGLTREEIIVFIYGESGTGKTTFIETIARCMGDYATMAVIESLTQRKNTMSDRHSTDFAKLQGSRLARAAETEEGRYWSTAKVNELTGGDMITARFMHQDNKDYVPKCKVVIHGNHKPKLRNPAGIDRRLVLVDFNHKVPEEQKNIKLKEELEAEYPGILASMIQGCLQWQEQGLCPPDTVLASTKAYFEDQEVVRHWLDECIIRTQNNNDTVWSSKLYKSFKVWCQSNGEDFASQKAFSQKLEHLGFKSKKNGAGYMVYKGIKLISFASEDDGLADFRSHEPFPQRRNIA